MYIGKALWALVEERRWCKKGEPPWGYTYSRLEAAAAAARSFPHPPRWCCCLPRPRFSSLISRQRGAARRAADPVRRGWLGRSMAALTRDSALEAAGAGGWRFPSPPPTLPLTSLLAALHERETWKT